MKATSFLTKEKFFKLIFESALIMFSVLLALFLNEYRGELKENQQKDLAMEMVQVELESNLETINEWLPYHRTVLSNLNEALKNDDIDTAIFAQNGELSGKFMPNGVVQSLIDNASWQTLRSSGISSKIDLNIMLTLSELYKLQSQGVESTLNSIIDILRSRESLEKENQRNTTILLRNAFREMVGQEIFLIAKYQQALIKLGAQDHPRDH